MTNRRVDTPHDEAELAEVVRLMDAKSSRREPAPADDGIRPTREGPWDPCRYQEYEISPEFRRQLLSAKLPQVDPAIFAETLPPTRVGEILAPSAASEPQPSIAEPSAVARPSPGQASAAAQPIAAAQSSPTQPYTDAQPSPRRANAAAQSSPVRAADRARRARVRRLLIVSTCIGLLIGFFAALSRKGPTRPAIATTEAPRIVRASGSSIAALPRQVASAEAAVAPAPARESLAAPALATPTAQHHSLAAVRSAGLPASQPVAASPSAERTPPPGKRVQRPPPVESFPLVEDE